MPPPVAKHSHIERHWGVVPIDQVGLTPGTSGNVLTDVGGNAAAFQPLPDFALESDLETAVANAYAAIGFFDTATSLCQAIGGWIASSPAATPSVQAAAGGAYGAALGTPGSNSIRIRSTASPQTASGISSTTHTFVIGRRYMTVIALRVIADPTPDSWAWIVTFPSGNTLPYAVTTPDADWVYLVDEWTAAATSTTAVGVGIIRDVDTGPATADIYVGYVQTFELPNPHGRPMALEVSPDNWQLWGNSFALFTANQDVAHSMFATGQLIRAFSSFFEVLDHEVTADAETTGLDYYQDFAYHWCEHTPGDLVEKGYQFDVGDDYVPVFLSEKDATTAQLHPGAGYTLELDGGGA